MTNKILLPPFRRARNRSKLVIGVGVAACSLHARGQEALRESIIGENAALVRRERAAAENYNIKAGPVNLRFDSILDAEFNDNINVSDQFAQSDFIFRPHLNMRTLWQVTPQNALDLNIGVGYTKYISHPRYDRLLITPDSELEFDLSIKEYQISFHDRISYSQNVIDQGSVSGDQATANHAALYGGLSNVGGVDVGRNYGRLSWTVGYDHSSFQASSIARAA